MQTKDEVAKKEWKIKAFATCFPFSTYTLHTIVYRSYCVDERERDKFAKSSFTFDVLQAIKQIIFGLARLTD